MLIGTIRFFLESIWSVLKNKNIYGTSLDKLDPKLLGPFLSLQIIKVLTGPFPYCPIIERNKTETRCICLDLWKNFKAITDICWQFLFELNCSAHNWTVPKVTETSLSCQHPLLGISDGAHLARFPQPTLQTLKSSWGTYYKDVLGAVAETNWVRSSRTVLTFLW